MLVKDLIGFNPLNEEIITEDQVFEMARVKPANSGLPWIIFISSQDYAKQRHWARIKVSNIKGKFSDSDNFVISIDKNPKVLAGIPKMDKSDLDDILDWVQLNYETLIKYWKDEYEDDADMYRDLKKI